MAALEMESLYAEVAAAKTDQEVSALRQKLVEMQQKLDDHEQQLNKLRAGKYLCMCMCFHVHTHCACTACATHGLRAHCMHAHAHACMNTACTPHAHRMHTQAPSRSRPSSCWKANTGRLLCWRS